MRRRAVVLGLPLLACGARALAGLSEADVQDVEVGSTSSGVLDPRTSSRLSVQTRLRTRDIRWVDRNGRVVDTASQTLVDNKYDWQETVQRSTDVWRVTAEDLKDPAWMVLRVRSTQDVALVVSLFPGAASAGRLDPELGIEVQPSPDASNEWLALFRFDPAVRTFVTVQAREAVRVPYRIAVVPAGRFRR